MAPIHVDGHDQKDTKRRSTTCLLVCLEGGERRDILQGGEFAFAASGAKVALKHGDVMLFDASQPHCFCEVYYKEKYEGADPPWRIVVSFYIKEDYVAHAAAMPRAD